MALVTRKEFAELCGKEAAYINVYITRKKISVLPSKLIDTENPLNKIFKANCKKIEKATVEKGRAEKREKKQPAPKPAKEYIEENYKKVVEVFTPEETPAQKKQREQQNEDDEEVIEWDFRKKVADALRSERAAEKAQLEIEKMMGALMPTDLVQQIFTVNTKDIFKTFETDLINIASIYCDILAGGDRAKLAEIIIKIRGKLTENIKRIELTTEAEIENVIANYAESRSRGERK